MKSAPLLLLLFSVAADAQIYRCESSSGQLSFQDHACAARAAEPPVQAAEVHVAYSDASGYTQGGWTDQQRWARRREAQIESRADNLRVQMLMQPAGDRIAARYAANRRRCRDAMRVASMCGTSGRPFSCDEKGFHDETITDVQVAVPGGTIDHGSRFKREQCALQAMKGR